MTCFLYYVWYDILAKTHSRMTIAIAFPHQNDAGSRAYYSVVVLVLESKALYCVIWFSVLTLEK